MWLLLLLRFSFSSTWEAGFYLPLSFSSVAFFSQPLHPSNDNLSLRKPYMSNFLFLLLWKQVLIFRFCSVLQFFVCFCMAVYFFLGFLYGCFLESSFLWRHFWLLVFSSVFSLEDVRLRRFSISRSFSPLKRSSEATIILFPFFMFFGISGDACLLLFVLFYFCSCLSFESFGSDLVYWIFPLSIRCLSFLLLLLFRFLTSFLLVRVPLL